MYHVYSAVMSGMQIVMNRGSQRMGLLNVLQGADAHVEALWKAGLGSRVCRWLNRLGRSKST